MKKACCFLYFLSIQGDPGENECLTFFSFFFLRGGGGFLVLRWLFLPSAVALFFLLFCVQYRFAHSFVIGPILLFFFFFYVQHFTRESQSRCCDPSLLWALPCMTPVFILSLNFLSASSLLASPSSPLLSLLLLFLPLSPPSISIDSQYRDLRRWIREAREEDWEIEGAAAAVGWVEWWGRGKLLAPSSFKLSLLFSSIPSSSRMLNPLLLAHSVTLSSSCGFPPSPRPPLDERVDRSVFYRRLGRG